MSISYLSGSQNRLYTPLGSVGLPRGALRVIGAEGGGRRVAPAAGGSQGR
jgi:hypothetical protein